MDRQGYAPIGGERGFPARWRANKLRVAAISSALLVTVVLLDRAGLLHVDTRLPPAASPAGRAPVRATPHIHRHHAAARRRAERHGKQHQLPGTVGNLKAGDPRLHFHPLHTQLFNRCGKVLRSARCDPARGRGEAVRNRCIACCSLASYNGECGAGSDGERCTRCCRIMLPTRVCRKFPHRRPCRDCCASLLAGWRCRVTGGADCRRCCVTLLESRVCANPVGPWVATCSRC